MTNLDVVWLEGEKPTFVERLVHQVASSLQLLIKNIGFPGHGANWFTYVIYYLHFADEESAAQGDL